MFSLRESSKQRACAKMGERVCYLHGGADTYVRLQSPQSVAAREEASTQGIVYSIAGKLDTTSLCHHLGGACYLHGGADSMSASREPLSIATPEMRENLRDD